MAWCKSAYCSEEAGHEGACHMNGIDVATWRRILKMPVAKSGDHWSCCMRPGSWEWFTDEAAEMRALLERAGYEQTTDSKRPWGVAWRRRAAHAERRSST